MTYDTAMTRNNDHANADFLNSLDEAWHDYPESYLPTVAPSPATIPDSERPPSLAASDPDYDDDELNTVGWYKAAYRFVHGEPEVEGLAAVLR